MVTNLPSIGAPFVLEAAGLAQLFPSLQRRGYHVVGPAVRGSAIVYDVLNSFEELPAGWTAEQEAGQYRLKRRDDGALFGYAVGAHGWKRFLYPAEARVFAAERNGHGFRILNGTAPPPRYAFLGMRACELAAMAIQDRVLLGEHYSETVYQARRHGVFLVAVNCTVSAPTCFCASMHTGPPAQAGFDLALTELVDAQRHIFLVEAGTRQGAEVLAELGAKEADATVRQDPGKALRRVRTSALGRSGGAVSRLRQLHHGLPDLLLHYGRGREQRRWQPRRTLAQVGFLFHAELFLYSRRQRAHVHQVALSPVADAQAGCLDRSVRQLRLCGLRALYHVVPGRHRHYPGGGHAMGAARSRFGPRRFEESTMTLENLANTLREHPFLQDFAAEHIDRLAAMASEVRFGKGELIFREGDESSFFYLLLAGKVALETNAPGRIVRIVTVGPGEELGWSSVTPSQSKQFQARSLEETRAVAFDGVRLQHACEEDCRFGYTLMTAMLRVVAHRLQSTRLQLLDMYSPVSAKVG